MFRTIFGLIISIFAVVLSISLFFPVLGLLLTVIMPFWPVLAIIAVIKIFLGAANHIKSL